MLIISASFQQRGTDTAMYYATTDLVVEGYLQELPLLVEGESGAAVPFVELSRRGRYLLKSKMFCELHLRN